MPDDNKIDLDKAMMTADFIKDLAVYGCAFICINAEGECSRVDPLEVRGVREMTVKAVGGDHV